MPNTSPTPPAYEPEAQYRVRLKKPVYFGPVLLRPLDDHTILGSALIAIVEANGAEAIDDATPVSE